MEAENLKYLIAVHRALNLTYPRFLKMKAFFSNDWRQAFGCKISDLQTCQLDKQGIERFLTRRDGVSPEEEIEKLEKCGAKVLIYGTPAYPVQLENIHYPPAILLVRGELRESDFPSISVIGSRGITSYGRRALEKIVSEIAQVGVTIVSGLAIGADTLAHRVAVKNGSRTICILGNGIDFIYPSQNTSFAEEILKQKKGVIISEYLPGEKPIAEHFPCRNRIIAGLSKATVIIEAAARSGTLITAKLALEQGRDIFAVPGELFARMSQGANQLIFDSGACPALSGYQILENLGLQKISPQGAIKDKIVFSEEESKVIKLFGNEHRVHINDLIRKSDMPAHVLSSSVALMEIKGLIKNIGNQTYTKNV